MDSCASEKCYNHSLKISLSQQTPLHIAANEGNRDVVDLLVENGGDINIRNKSGVGR